MIINKYFYFNVFKNLLAVDFQIFRENLFDKIIDLFTWVVCTLLIMGYVMPMLGLSNDYGIFQMAGLVASAGLFEIFPNVMNLISDFEGDKLISYELILPVPSWLIFIKLITNYAASALILALIVIPMSKIILWNQFDMTKISIIPFILMMIIISIFYGVFTLLIASMVKTVQTIRKVWMRFLFPLWILGGFQFSWFILHKLVPNLAYLNLLNPITYVMEGLRAALLGQEGYIHYVYCILALIIFSILFGYIAIARLKKRLDYV